MLAATLTASRFASTAESRIMESTGCALRILEAPGPSSMRAAIHSRTAIRSMLARLALLNVGRVWLSRSCR